MSSGGCVFIQSYELVKYDSSWQMLDLIECIRIQLLSPSNTICSVYIQSGRQSTYFLCFLWEEEREEERERGRLEDYAILVSRETTLPAAAKPPEEIDGHKTSQSPSLFTQTPP